jgi:Flp pilus assembly protein TadB
MPVRTRSRRRATVVEPSSTDESGDESDALPTASGTAPSHPVESSTEEDDASGDEGMQSDEGEFKRMTQEEMRLRRRQRQQHLRASKQQQRRVHATAGAEECKRIHVVPCICHTWFLASLILCALSCLSLWHCVFVMGCLYLTV